MESGPNLVCIAVLLALAPVTVALFAIMPSRRAMVVGAIVTSVLVPPIGIDVPGLPGYDRFMALFVGVFFGTLLFDMRRILSLRPRWFDLPIVLFCLSPYATAISVGLTPYDGLAAAFRQVVLWLFPYLIGRLYLTDADSFRDLATGMIVSAVCMIPFCFLEMRIGTQVQRFIYGTGSFEGLRDGGFRPKLFFQSGLALGLWMNTATLLAWWFWRRGIFRSLWGLPSGSVILPALVTTSVLCRTKGANLLGLAGWFTLWSCTRFKSKWVIWLLLAVAPTYFFVRTTNLWTGESFVSLVEVCLGKERAGSFAIRLAEEKVLITNGLKKPILGCGGYGAAHVITDPELLEDESVPIMLKDGVPTLMLVDSLWSLIFGEMGFNGLVLMTLAMVLPVIRFLRRFPVSRWTQPDLSPVAGMAVVLSLFLIDDLSNAMLNPVYIIIAGGLGNIELIHTGLYNQSSNRRAGSRTAGGPGDEPTIAVAAGYPVPAADLASRYQSLGRAARDRGQFDEAEAAWQHALDLLTESRAAHPENQALRRRWCDCANDLAWLLAGAGDAAVRDPDGAVALAAKAVELEPECSTYWNTLGAAHYRAGRFQGAIADLDQATALSDGGTAFDHVFLAMAHAQSGNLEDARRWLDLTTTALEQDPPGYSELCHLCEEARAMLSAASGAASTP